MFGDIFARGEKQDFGSHPTFRFSPWLRGTGSWGIQGACFLLPPLGCGFGQRHLFSLVNLHFRVAFDGELALERAGPVVAHLSHASWYWW